MAKFEGVKWAPQQMRYLLADKQFDLLESDAKVPAVSRSIFYATFLCFEGIRFFCKMSPSGRLEVNFLNWHRNLERFRRGIAFNLSKTQAEIVPSVEELETIIVHQYFKEPAIRAFLEEMAGLGAQGYLRPFTVDEEQSMGVTFPGQPAVRALFCRYDNYLGEPFTGVVIPHLVRAVAANKTGWLKLGINYLVSLKALEAAKDVDPGAAAALFLDDQTHLPLADRRVTEWDSSCCLFGLRDGTVIKIPESELILPSITIQGMVTILRDMGTKVEERHVSYSELLRLVRANELVVAASIGTAGIMNRCQKLHLVDEKNAVAATHVPDRDHPLYGRLAEAKAYYWDIYREKVKLPAGMNLFKYAL
jgi:branched-subunit amino acid aminotransferase/4-amino-4-deoxychorismate lyase